MQHGTKPGHPQDEQKNGHPNHPPTQVYTARAKATPIGGDGHWRIGPDEVDKTGRVTLRHRGRLHHVGLGQNTTQPLSWLLAGGADLAAVMELLGHRQIMTAQQYLHTLPDADRKALEAFSAIRRPKR